MWPPDTQIVLANFYTSFSIFESIVYLRLHLYLPYWLIIGFCEPPISTAHEFDDGHVERAVEVVIRDDVATVKYFLGLNENSMSQALNTWGEEQPQLEENEVSIASRFESKLSEHLQSGLKVQLRNKQIFCDSAELSPSQKHPFTFVASFNFELPQGHLLEFSLIDETFQEMDSAARYSLKGMGTTMVLNSNVAPIIIRAKRHELSKMTAVNRVETCKIAATVAIATANFKKEDTVHVK